MKNLQRVSFFNTTWKRMPAEFLAKAMGTPLSLFVPMYRRDLGFSPLRAPYLELSIDLWRLDSGEDLPSWKEGIHKFLEERHQIASRQW